MDQHCRYYQALLWALWHRLVLVYRGVPKVLEVQYFPMPLLVPRDQQDHEVQRILSVRLVLCHQYLPMVQNLHVDPVDLPVQWDPEDRLVLVLLGLLKVLLVLADLEFQATHLNP